MFSLVDKLDHVTNNKFHLTFVRNKAFKYLNELNPFVGKLALKSHDLPEINITLSKKAIDGIGMTIENSQAVMNDTSSGYLTNANKSYENTSIEYKGNIYQAKIRIHGTDSIHYSKAKKSFYIKLDDEKLINNMRRFSLIILEDSGISSFFSYKMQEWLNGFKVNSFLVKLNINGVQQGTYALEEKLHKTLLERNNFSGVDILKPNDEWDQQYSSYGGSTRHVNPYNWDIASTKMQSISNKDVGQLIQYENLYKCKNYECVAQLIDEDRTAQVDAMRILLGTYHVFRGDNQKLLYDTSSGRFFPYFRTEATISKLDYFFDKKLYGGEELYKNNFIYQLGKGENYRERRNKYLWKLLQNKDFLIQTYFDLYDNNMPPILSDSSHYTNGRYIRYLENIKKNNLVSNFLVLEKYLNYSKVSTNLKYIDTTSLQLSITPDSNVHIALSKINFEFEGHSVVSIKDNETGVVSEFDLNDPLKYFNNKKFISSFNNSYDVVKKDLSFLIKVDDKTTINGFNVAYKNLLSNEEVLDRNSYINFQPFSQFSKFSLSSFLIKNDNGYSVNEGKYILNDNLIIPYGQSLTINPGVKISIQDNKSILVYGDLFINGTLEKPVQINNLKNRFGTFAALGNGLSEVKIKFLNLSGGSEAIINGVHYSGALSLYFHKNVSINGSNIYSNFADDGLNIKNSNISLINNVFELNTADQVDLDNCVGEINNNQFVQSSLEGNFEFNDVVDKNGDGLDLSGSKVIINNNKYYGFLDKAISVGENTKAIISLNTFKDNNRAVTVKDQSDAYFISNFYDKNKVNIELYRKKLAFDYPSAFNLNEKHPKEKIMKSNNSHYYKPKNLLSIEANVDIEKIFIELSNGEWIEFD